MDGNDDTKSKFHLNHLSDQGTFTPVGAQGGSMEPLRKPLFHQNFAMKFAPYMYALHQKP